MVSFWILLISYTLQIPEDVADEINHPTFGGEFGSRHDMRPEVADTRVLWLKDRGLHDLVTVSLETTIAQLLADVAGRLNQRGFQFTPPRPLPGNPTRPAHELVPLFLMKKHDRGRGSSFWEPHTVTGTLTIRHLIYHYDFRKYLWQRGETFDSLPLTLGKTFLFFTVPCAYVFCSGQDVPSLRAR